MSKFKLERFESIRASKIMALGQFSPLNIPDLKMWFKADSLSLSDSDPVSTWEDSSGNGFDVSGTGTSRPIFKTNILNGKPVVRFDGTNDVLSVGSFSSTQPLTVILVFHPTAIPVSGTSRIFNMDDASANIHWTYGASDTLIYAGTPFSSVLAVEQTWRVNTFKFNGASSAIYYNGALDNSGDAGSSNPSSTTFSIGDYSYGATDPFPGDIAEVLVYENLSDANREALEDYLGEKYGITITH